MHNEEYYDNLMAYSYDDYIEPKEDDTEDYLEDRAITDALEYEAMMAQQMIDNLYDSEK